MSSGAEHALEDAKSKYNELTRSLSSLFPQFQNASARLIEELTRKAQDLEAQEELHRTRAENDRATIARLQEDNLALQQIKQNYDQLRIDNDRKQQLLDNYSSRIDMLQQDNGDLRDQSQLVASEASTLRLKNNELTEELNHKDSECARLMEQCELDKRTELSNQAIEHQKSMSKAKRVFEESLAKLEADFNRQKEAVKLRDKEIEKLSRELKVMPLHLKAQLVRTIQQQPTRPPPRVVANTIEPGLRANPVRPMRAALVGSDYTTSTSSSSSSCSRRRHSADPFARNDKRLR